MKIDEFPYKSLRNVRLESVRLYHEMSRKHRSKITETYILANDLSYRLKNKNYRNIFFKDSNLLTMSDILRQLNFERMYFKRKRK